MTRPVDGGSVLAPPALRLTCCYWAALTLCTPLSSPRAGRFAQLSFQQGGPQEGSPVSLVACVLGSKRRSLGARRTRQTVYSLSVSQSEIPSSGSVTVCAGCGKSQTSSTTAGLTCPRKFTRPKTRQKEEAHTVTAACHAAQLLSLPPTPLSSAPSYPSHSLPLPPTPSHSHARHAHAHRIRRKMRRSPCDDNLQTLVRRRREGVKAEAAEETGRRKRRADKGEGGGRRAAQ
eukprot:513987-Hanusia_phi.AAC.3